MKFVSTVLTYKSNNGIYVDEMKCWKSKDIKLAALNHVNLIQPGLELMLRRKGNFTVTVDCWKSEYSTLSPWTDFEEGVVITIHAELTGLLREIDRRIKKTGGFPLSDFNMGSVPKNNRGKPLFTPIIMAV